MPLTLPFPPFSVPNSFSPNNIAKSADVDANFNAIVSAINAIQNYANGYTTIYNVKQYGAVMDGVTDDTDACQQAILACYNGGGGIVLIPPGNIFFNGGSGTIPNPAPPAISPAGGVIPQGPLLGFDNVTLSGMGRGTTTIHCGPGFYNGGFTRPPKTTGGSTQPYAGNVISNNGYWIQWAGTYITQRFRVRDLTINCNGNLATGAGAHPPPPNTVLSGSAVELHAVYGGTVENVEVINGNVNGIFVYGVLGGGGGTVPACDFLITRCSVNLNYPKWLAGSNSLSGGSNGQLPIRTEGITNGVVSFNNVGDLCVGSNDSYNLPPNTNDGIDVPSTGNLVVMGNRVTNCGDGIGTNGMSNITIVGNVLYNVGSVGLANYSSSLGVSASRLVLANNVVYDCGNNGAPNPGIQVTGPGPGPVTICGNELSSSTFSTSAIDVHANGVKIFGNTIDLQGTNKNCISVNGNNANVYGNDCLNGGSGSTGINVPSGATNDRMTVFGNIFDSSIATPINIQGTLTHSNFYGHAGNAPTIVAPVLTGGGGAANNPYPYQLWYVLNSPSAITSITVNGVNLGYSTSGAAIIGFPVPAQATVNIVVASGTPTLVATAVNP